MAPSTFRPFPVTWRQIEKLEETHPAVRAYIMAACSFHPAILIENNFWRAPALQYFEPVDDIRSWLLKANDLVILTPFLWAWILCVLSFATTRRSFCFSSCGAIILLPVLAGLDFVLSRILGIRVVLFSIYGYMLANFGFAIGYYLSFSTFAEWLIPSTTIDKDDLAEDSTLAANEHNDEEKLSGKADAAPVAQSKQEEAANLNIQSIFCMIWMAAIILSTNVNISFPLILNRGREDPVDMIDLVACVACDCALLGGYAFITFRCIKSNSSILQEIATGLSASILSMTFLRLHTPSASWQSWIVDGMLAFVIFNLGWLAGHLLR